MIEIRFTPTNSNSELTLTIGEAAQGATATRVEGTRDVFITNEEDDSDVFMPVRTTSGTVRFYNKDNAWSQLADISNTHQPVVLSQGSAVLWQGYINKGYVGTRRLFGYNEECEIAVQCPLMELDTVDYEPVMSSETAMMTLAEVVQDILDDPFGDGLVSSPTLSFSDGADTILALKVYAGWFYKKETENDGTVTDVPRYTRKEALEEVLKMACCTARWTGTSVSVKSVKEMPSGGTSLVVDPADTQNEESAFMPFKNITVNASAEGGDSSAIQFPTNAIRGWVDQYGVPGNVETEAVNWGLIPKVIAYMEGFLVTQATQNWFDVVDNEYTYYSTSNGSEILAYQEKPENWQYNGFNLTASAWINKPSNLTDWLNNIVPFIFSIETKTSFFIQDAILAVQMRVMAPTLPNASYNGSILFRIRIGNKFYNPAREEWQEYEGSAQDPDWYIEAAVENGEVKRTKNLDFSFSTYSGYGINVKDALSGLLRIDVKSSQSDLDLVLILDSVEIKAVRHTAGYLERDTFTYKGLQGSGSDDIQLAFCSERRSENAGNFLFDSNGKVVNTVTIGGVAMRPEQWVANRHGVMTTGKVRGLLTLRQKGSAHQGNIYAYNNRIYDTLAVSHDWGEGITDLHLIDIKS